MLDRDLIRKLREEERLSAAEEAAVQSALEAGPLSMKMAGELWDEPVSLAWRSQLNERIGLASSVVKRKARWLFVVRPALGLGLAGALAFAFMTRIPTVPPVVHKPAVEAALIEAHELTVQGSEIAGAGLAQHEAVPVASNSDADLFDWSEVDVETL